MNLVVTFDEICTAPVEVQKWFAGKLSCVTAMDVKPEVAQVQPEAKPEAKPVEKPEVKPEPAKPIAIEKVMDAASSYLSAKGNDALKAVLAKFGIARARECPEDKRAEFLAEVALA